MKTQIKMTIIGLLAISGTINAQWTATCPETTTCNVGIGITTPSYPLHVKASNTGSAGKFELKQSSTSPSQGSALQGIVTDGTNQAPQNIGVYGESSNAAGNYGGFFWAFGGSGNNIGVYATCFNGTGSGLNTGIYADAGVSSTSWAGYFQGRTNFSGQVFGSQFGWSSDKRFKKNIVALENASDKLFKIKGYSYEYRTDEFAKKNFATGTQFGFIAQELREVFPELVTEGEEGYYYVNYVGMIPVMLEAMKKQQKQIDELLSRNNASGVGSTTGIGSVNPSETKTLEQNIPNPFTGETNIKYNIPTNTGKAQLLVYDLSGKQVKAFPIATTGSSAITITSADLAPGIYIYSIFADGAILDSKRMVVADK